MKKILLVDVKEEVGSVLKKTQDEEGYAVLTVSGLKDAKEFIKNLFPDLIIVDVGISTLDGLDLMKSIIAKKKVPVIVLTPYGQEEKGLEFLSSDIYLAKSDEPSEIKNMVRKILFLS